MRIEEQMQVGMRKVERGGDECKQINSDIGIANDTRGFSDTSHRTTISTLLFVQQVCTSREVRHKHQYMGAESEQARISPHITEASPRSLGRNPFFNH